MRSFYSHFKLLRPSLADGVCAIKELLLLLRIRYRYTYDASTMIPYGTDFLGDNFSLYPINTGAILTKTILIDYDTFYIARWWR